jgi:hypothetical protein
MGEKKDRHFGVTRRLILEAGTAAAALSFVGDTRLARAAGPLGTGRRRTS